MIDHLAVARAMEFLQEQSFIATKHSPFYMKCCSRHFWALIQRRDRFNATIVQEFYAAASSSKSLNITLRNVPIVVDAQMVREIRQHRHTGRLSIYWKRRQFTGDAKMLLHLITDNILPTSHKSTGTREMALLTYLFHHRYRVDFPSLIIWQFRKAATSPRANISSTPSALVLVLPCSLEMSG